MNTRFEDLGGGREKTRLEDMRNKKDGCFVGMHVFWASLEGLLHLTSQRKSEMGGFSWIGHDSLVSELLFLFFPKGRRR